jgi:hypothetical protein
MVECIVIWSTLTRHAEQISSKAKGENGGANRVSAIHLPDVAQNSGVDAQHGAFNGTVLPTGAVMHGCGNKLHKEPIHTDCNYDA